MKPFVPALARSAPAPATGLAAASSAGSSGGAESDFLSANTPSKRTIKHSKDQPNEPLQEQMHECKKKQMKQTKHRCQQLCNTRQNLMVTLVQSQLRGMLVYCGEHSVSQCLGFSRPWRKVFVPDTQSLPVLSLPVQGLHKQRTNVKPPASCPPPR
jgi:hypothetical protein